jgi:hypothetical protein
MVSVNLLRGGVINVAESEKAKATPTKDNNITIKLNNGLGLVVSNKEYESLKGKINGL